MFDWLFGNKTQKKVQELEREIELMKAKDKQYIANDYKNEDTFIYLFDNKSIRISSKTYDYISVYKREEIEIIRDFLLKHFPLKEDK